MIRPICLLLMLTGCDKLLVSDSDVLPLYDQDGDGFYAPESTAIGEAGPYDCDDENASVHPGAEDVCNGRDDDCNGAMDDGDAAVTWYVDADGDGWGDTEHPRQQCDQPNGFIARGGDCDDSDEAINPDATEVCGGTDEDCDGATDDDDPSVTGQATWYADIDGDGYGDPSAPLASCEAVDGYVATAGDCDDGNDSISPVDIEVCNGEDDDCDGDVDADDSDLSGGTTYYRDADGDGFGDEAVATVACGPVSGYVADATDCDDGSASTHPGAAEHCDMVDEDCDGETYDGDSVDAMMVWPDADGDGYGDRSASGTVGCLTSGWVTDSSDCDDALGTAFPGATEYCSDGVDDNCNGSWFPCIYDATVSGTASHALAALSVTTSVSSGSQTLYFFDSTRIATVKPPLSWASSSAATDPTTLASATWTSGAVAGSIAVQHVSDDYLIVAFPHATSGTPPVPAGAVYSCDLTTGTSYNVSSCGYLVGQTSELVGTAVAGAGSFGGSKLVAVAASAASSSKGRVYLVSPSAFVGGLEMYKVDSETIDGVNASDEFGNALDAGHDLDGDGYDDLVVAAPGVSSGTGAVYVFTDVASGSIDASSADETYGVSVSGASFGSALWAGNDFDADGYVDLVVGATSDDTAGTNAGAAYVFLGPASSSSSADASLYGAASEAAGSTLGGADVDIIGVEDIMVGASGTSTVYALPYVAGTTNLADADHAFHDATSIFTLGDIDSDGREDFFLLGSSGLYLFDHDEL